jgi:hypothetical protein
MTLQSEVSYYILTLMLMGRNAQSGHLKIILLKLDVKIEFGCNSFLGMRYTKRY